MISQRFLDEERYRNVHLRVINALDDLRILGVHIPELKNLAKELSRRPDAADLIASLEAESFQKVTVRLDSIDFSRIQSEFLSPKEAKVAEQVRGVAKGERPYYVRMAVAWLLTTALAKLHDQTRAYVNACNLPEDLIRLYKRKARESFRTRYMNRYRFLYLYKNIIL